MDLAILGKDPISSDQPAGSDIRYDPIFDELQAEIDKLSIPSAVGAVDWVKVVKLSSEILSSKSKDLLVASYLAVSLMYANKVEGLNIGLKVYQNMLENYWDNLFPSKVRIKRRLGAIEWWLEKTETALKQMENIVFSSEQLKQIRESFEKIDKFIIDQNIEDAPTFSHVYEVLDYLVQINQKSSVKTSPEVAEKVPVPVEVPEDSTEAEFHPSVEEKVQEVKETEVSEKISSQEDAQKALEKVLQKMGEVAAYLWQQDLSNPLAYRLARISEWLSIEDLPPSIDNQTRIPPPDPNLRDTLVSLRNSGDAEALLRFAEEKFSEFVLWLDLQRFASEALILLGDHYKTAHEAVCQETACFINRFPGLKDLSFSDGMPFADSDTNQWFHEIALSVGPIDTESLSMSESLIVTGDEDQIEKEMKEAKKLIKKGEIIEAIKRFQEKMNTIFSQRDKLLWRLALIQVLLHTRHSELAIPHIEKILTDIDFYRLEEYDPLISLKALKLAWMGFNLQSDQNLKNRAAALINRIALIDLNEMIKLEKAAKKKKTAN